MKILVVEAQKTLGMALSWSLGKLGHETRLVMGGAAAWDIVDREDWRLIITDWMMPEIDGIELCRRIRGRVGGPYRYIIMLTGRSERSDRLEGLNAGADDFLTKPVDQDELVIRLAVARRILAVQDDLEASVARLHTIAGTDPLTGLSNRRHLEEELEMALARAARGVPFSIIAVDIDHFKSYNDSFGHAAGDEVLRAVATRLRAGTRATDSVFRTGGEEFLVLMPGMGKDESLAVAHRLRGAIALNEWPTRPVTASFGVTTVADSATRADHAVILEVADRALYHSKRSGRNRVTHIAPLPVMSSSPHSSLVGRGAPALWTP